MFKSLEELSDWICPIGRGCVLAHLRDTWSWHNKEMNGELILLPPAGSARGSPSLCWAESFVDAPWPAETTGLQLMACGLELTRSGAWLRACSLDRSLGTAAPLLLICSSWRPGLGNWKEHKTFLSLEGLHSSIWGLGASPYSLFQCLWGSCLY